MNMDEKKYIDLYSQARLNGYFSEILGKFYEK